MAKCMSIAASKGIRAGKQQEEPGEGTKLRELFDHLQEHKGEVISLNGFSGNVRKKIYTLVDIYGLDIRSFGRGRNSQWCLVGEWFGKIYVDYLAEREEEKKCP